MELLESKTAEIVAIVVLCLSATLGVIVAVVKGRRIAWCIPCTLFPPLIALLVVLPATRNESKVFDMKSATDFGVRSRNNSP